MNTPPPERDLSKAALRGEPSYIWREGQDRRLAMIVRAGKDELKGIVLDNGCGVGMYVQHLSPLAGKVYGLEYEFDRAREAHLSSERIVNAAGEALPLPNNSVDLILSHEVLEHVQDDRQVVAEMVRVLRPSGRIVIFAPNRGYPFETHGIYWRGRYHFGNIPLVNYLPRPWRNRLAPHVRVYTRKDMLNLFKGLPVRIVEHTVIFGAYDNIIARHPALGRRLRAMLQWLESSPLRVFGLSHFLVVEKYRPTKG